MSTFYNHIEVNNIAPNGDVDVLYMQNTGEDVLIDNTNANIPTGVNTLQDMVDRLSDVAFEDSSNFVFIGEGEDYTGDIIESEINDVIKGTSTTWSSEKISKIIEDNTTAFIPSYNMTEDIVEALPITPKIYNVNTVGFKSDNIPSAGNGLYLVEYFPMVTNSSSVSGNIGDKNIIEYAMQRWTKVNSTDSVKVFTRFFANGKWTNFMS